MSIILKGYEFRNSEGNLLLEVENVGAFNEIVKEYINSNQISDISIEGSNLVIVVHDKMKGIKNDRKPRNI